MDEGRKRGTVTGSHGTLSYHTLDALGITEIDLMGDATNIELPDGSVITGQTTFTMNGQTRTVGEMTLATDGRGYRLVETESTSGGTTTHDIEAYGASGELAWAIHVVAATDGSNTVNSYDDMGALSKVFRFVSVSKKLNGQDSFPIVPLCSQAHIFNINVSFQQSLTGTINRRLLECAS